MSEPSLETEPSRRQRAWHAVRTQLLQHPRRVWALICIISVSLLTFGLYLQHVTGLEPCPMCIMQRYVWVVLALVSLLGALTPGLGAVWIVGLWDLVLAIAGACVAARQSWLQWYPPEVATCGRDFYGIVDTFPLHRALPMIFQGSGDCTAVDWTFLGGSIANWSFVWFVLAILLIVMALWFAAASQWRNRRAV
ncbi:MAG: hypothetical protein RLZZ24_747 [Pseudomonadota bacterium]|jgi:disulfide bond formation protein DsbB